VANYVTGRFGSEGSSLDARNVELLRAQSVRQLRVARQALPCNLGARPVFSRNREICRSYRLLDGSVKNLGTCASAVLNDSYGADTLTLKGRMLPVTTVHGGTVQPATGTRYTRTGPTVGAKDSSHGPAQCD
jgi:hypothetical protein